MGISPSSRRGGREADGVVAKLKILLHPRHKILYNHISKTKGIFMILTNRKSERGGVFVGIIFLFLTVMFVGSAPARMCKFDITNCTFDSIRFSSGHGAGWSAHNSNNPTCSVSGISACSTTSGTFGTAIDGSPSTDDGSRCWCMMTAPRGGRWVFDNVIGATAGCAQLCAYFCAFYVQHNTSFRAAVLALP